MESLTGQTVDKYLAESFGKDHATVEQVAGVVPEK